MRIIAGQHRGRRLEASKGMGTRPTVDRVRESLMSAINSARGGFEDAVVLDAFAGSGALGLEALSRGAKAAVFFERDNGAFRTLCANCQLLGYDTRGRAVGGQSVRAQKADVLKTPPLKAGKPFDLVFLDPPYALATDEVFSLLDALLQAGVLADEALVSYEHSADANDAVDAALAAREPLFSLDSRRTYGDTVIDIFTIG